MYYIVSKKRILIIIFLMILEILFLSLAIRSYGNKFEYYEAVKASENDKSNFKLETNASWPGNEYKLNEKSSCINKDGQKEENDLEFSDVSNQIVMKFDSSVDCYLYFEEE